MKKIVFITLMFAFFAAPSIGMPPNEWNPVQQQARDELKPWYQQIRQRIRAEIGFEELVRALGEKQIYCCFRLNKSGEMEDLKIVGLKTSVPLEEAVLSFVRKAAPIPKPPNELPYKLFANELAPVFAR